MKTMKTNFGARLLALTALIAMPIMLAHPLTARGASVADDMFFGGKVEATGAFKAKSTAEILGNLTRKGEILTVSTVSLTSPTVTFSAKNLGMIVLKPNASLTGIYPTGGTLGQVITILSYPSGSYTMRFDDGTSMSLGGSNITLTESSDDCLSLVCTSTDTDGNEWRILAMPTTAGSFTTFGVSGASTLHAVTATTVTTVGFIQTGASTRTGQVFTFTTAKAGATAGWAVNAALDTWQSTLPASQTSSTLVIPCSGLHKGDIITGAYVLGQAASGGNAYILEGSLRKFTNGAASNTDSSVGAIARLTATSNTAFGSGNAMTGTLAETVAEGTTYYVLVIGTTASGVTMGIQGAGLIVTKK